MIDQVQPQHLSDWMAAQAAHGVVRVLDVREDWELQTAAIQPDGFDFSHIPMSLVPAKLGELRKDQPIACLCHHGGRSMQVAYFLAQQGFSHVANIAGGIHAWSMQLDPKVPQY